MGYGKLCMVKLIQKKKGKIVVHGKIDQKGKKGNIVVCLYWNDVLICAGNKKGVLKVKKKKMERFDCDEIGELKEYVGCKVERKFKEDWIKSKQPVLLQIFADEFGLDGHSENSADIFTKNVGRSAFEGHILDYVRD